MRSVTGLHLEYFEQRLAEFSGTRYAIATGSGRAALGIALRSLDIEGGNIVVANLTCHIVPQTVISAGFTPFFVDVNGDLSLNLETLENNFDKENRAVIVNYLYGCPTDNIRRLIDLAKERHLFIIEDAAQSFGAKINGKQVGAWGDIGILSFSKCFFSLFRGGAIVTNDKRLADNARKCRAQEQGSPNMPYLYFKYFMRDVPKPAKILYSGLRARIWLKASLSYLSRFCLSHWLSSGYPIQFQHLTNFEIKSALNTLSKLEELKAKRVELVKEIAEVICDRPDLGLQLAFMCQPGFVYTRVPVIIEGSTLNRWITYFQNKGIIIDMIYKPLSEDIRFRDTAMVTGGYDMSRVIAESLLPLPVNQQLVKVLKDINPDHDL